MNEIEVWNDFAEATENLAEIYPDIKKTSVWKMLVDNDMILDEEN